MSDFKISPELCAPSIPSTLKIADEVQRVLASIGVDLTNYSVEYHEPRKDEKQSGRINLRTPITGESFGSISESSQSEIEDYVASAHSAFLEFRNLPAPARGEFVRVLGNLLREYKHELGFLVSVEAGKIVSEGLGEVQEMIDVADFAVGLSRQLYGKVIASERPNHAMRETWHPLGVVGVVTAFNFPAAVWAWNACISFVCGDPVVFKPSDKCSVIAIACHELARRAAREVGISDQVSQLVLGGAQAATDLANNEKIALLSVTGSVQAGSALAPLVQKRYGRTLLELGGNNAMIVTPSADLDLAVRAITFSAAGTAGQRCTTLRRLILHKSISDELLNSLATAYKSLKVGNPFSEGVLVGPVISISASEALDESCGKALQSGEVIAPMDRELDDQAPQAYYRRPGIIKVNEHIELLNHETFAPLLYAVEYEEIAQAIDMNNSVPQGLSSSIFTNDIREAELFLSNAGSDCGIANVNIGPSGAEIGGAFGGEKTTGGGRESGSDAWKTYMRVQTNTVNYGDSLPLAQGVEFI
jgi:aldehyde dehydrogenase (NAD+)